MRNLTRALASNMMLASVVALLFSGVALAQDQADKDADTVYEVGNGVKVPKGIYMPNPKYADGARKKEDQR